jgi:hypothetical protein
MPAAPRRLTLLLPALAVLALAVPASAQRYFGSIFVGCDTFGDCHVSPEMPEPPDNPASLKLGRSSKANAPVEISIHVNKPVEGGIPIRLELGDAVFTLQPATDVLTRRQTIDDAERVVGYYVAQPRAGELIAAMRKAARGRLMLDVAGRPQERVIQLDGLDAALRWIDERQGRSGAQDALIDTGERAAANAQAPRRAPKKADWPAEILRIFKREKCSERIYTFDELTAGFVATPAPGRELWGIACDGGNYNTEYILIDVRNGDMKTARVVKLPVRSRKLSLGSAANPMWWDARKELWAFHRGHSHGTCGTVAQYQWTEAGFKLTNERRKDDCEWVYDDPWTRWPEVKAPRSRSKR